MDKKIFLIGLMMLFLASFVSAEPLFGTFQENTCINLLQTCASCSFNNITIITDPAGNTLIKDQEMTREGFKYNYTFCNTSLTGIYQVNGIGDPNATNTIWRYDLAVNPSGKIFNNILYEFLFFGVIMFVFYFILYIAFKHENLPTLLMVSFGIMFMAVYVLRFGIANFTNDYTDAFSIINIGLSAYFLLGGSIELIKQLND
jgi:hypothetical protein